MTDIGLISKSVESFIHPMTIKPPDEYSNLIPFR
jgi:hypothetical protein